MTVDLTAKFDVPAELVAATDKAVIRKLSVGAGAKDKDEGYTTIDIAGDPDVRWDITQTPWPFESDYFRGVKAHHILEHFERKFLVSVMNEMWRILEPDGRLWLELPLFPTEDAVADPTHVSFFVSQTFDYFCKFQQDGKVGQFEEQRLLYGIKPWAMQRREKLNYGRILYVLLRKVAE